MRIDSGRKSEQDFLFHLSAGSLFFYGRNFFGIVRYKAADTAFHRVRDVFICLVVAMEIRFRKRIARLDGSIYFSGGNDIDPHCLFRHDFINALKAIGLAGIQRLRGGSEVFLKRSLIHPAIFSDFILVHEIERGPVFFGQFHRVLTGKLKAPVFFCDIVAYHVIFNLSRYLLRFQNPPH